MGSSEATHEAIRVTLIGMGIDIALGLAKIIGAFLRSHLP